MNIKVFVYGTLKDDRANRKKAHIVGQMVSLHSFPAVMIDESRFKFNKNPYMIEGEIIEADSELMDRMDGIEGIPHLYTKEKVKTIEGDDVIIYQGNTAWESSSLKIEPDKNGVASWGCRTGCWGVYEEFGV